MSIFLFLLIYEEFHSKLNSKNIYGIPRVGMHFHKYHLTYFKLLTLPHSSSVLAIKIGKPLSQKTPSRLWDESQNVEDQSNVYEVSIISALFFSIQLIQKNRTQFKTEAG